MEDKDLLPPLSFERMLDYLRPTNPVTVLLEDDYRLIAGLLFRRWNDGTRRTVENYPEEEPHVLIERPHWGQRIIRIRQAAVDCMKEKRYLEPLHDNRFEYMLSARAKRKVVERWFNDASFHDFMVAGARYDSREGTFCWAD